MNWFRFYHAALDDPKVQRLDGALFKAWVNLLCLASEGEERGWLPSIADIGFRLRTAEQDAESIVSALIDGGLIDTLDGRLMMHNWPNRQPVSDDVAARVTKHREAKKQAVTLQETLQKQECNVLDKIREDKNKEEQQQAAATAPLREKPPPSRYETTLNGAMPRLLDLFKALDKQYTDQWLRSTLAEVEQTVGPLSRNQLGRGLDLAADQIKRRIERGKVDSPRAFARKLIVDYLTEQRDEHHAA